MLNFLDLFFKAEILKLEGQITAATVVFYIKGKLSQTLRDFSTENLHTIHRGIVKKRFSKWHMA